MVELGLACMVELELARKVEVELAHEVELVWGLPWLYDMLPFERGLLLGHYPCLHESRRFSNCL